MNGDVNYQQTLDYLYSFVDYSMTRSMRWSADKFDLGRMERLTQALGNPQRAYPSLHIAGTKGKGSVSAMIASVLRAEGYRVGLYTSPHMHDYTERICVNGSRMPHADLIALVDELRPLFDSQREVTTFEITTALAFLYFARQQVDVAVIEVGLGGRLDATNVVVPVVSVITSISYDHTQILGNTLAEIAAEKAGIIKPQTPVVSSPQREEARSVIERIAAERAAPLFLVGRDYAYQAMKRSLQGQSLLVWRSNAVQEGETNPNGAASAGEPTLLNIPLLGAHQLENAATAYAALDVFRQRSLPVSEQAIASGFPSTVWPGRFEILSQEPALVIDSAHNRDSAAKLAQTVREYFPGRPVLLIFGASEDKDISGMLAELLPVATEAIFTRSFHPRAADPQHLAAIATENGASTRIVAEVADALDAALRGASAESLILATGSIFIATAVREAWLTRQGLRLPVG